MSHKQYEIYRLDVSAKCNGSKRAPCNGVERIEANTTKGPEDIKR